MKGKCTWCAQEVCDNTDSCDDAIMEDDERREYTAVPYDGTSGDRCPECYVTKGGIHHPGCGLEKCPKCGKKILECGHNFY